MEDLFDKLTKFIKGLFAEDENKNDEDEWENEDVINDLKKQKAEKQNPAIEARVRCTCCIEKSSEIYVYSMKTKNVDFTGGKEQLNHKDILFRDTFKGCTNTEGAKCTIDILDDTWFDYDTKTMVGDGYALDYNESYMICLTGLGMIYLSDSGQIRGNMEDKSENELLDILINEKAFKAMGWEEKAGKLTILNVYGNDIFDELKYCMEKYGIVNSVSIKMFLATIRHESGSGSRKLEIGGSNYFNNVVSYSGNVRGAGLIQITGTGNTQKQFLEYIYASLPANDANKEIIKKYIDGYTNNGNDNAYIDPNTNQTVAEFIASDYPVESATWFWAKFEKMSYSEGKMKGKKETLNDFVLRHANDNQYNTFVATQMAVNGTAYGAFALDRFAECQNDCQIVKTPSTGCGGNHSSSTGYCFLLTENSGNNGGNVQRHDYGPRNWEDREDAYTDACDYLNKMGQK